MIKPLTKWVLTDIHPAFYDSESLSVLEQTGRVYAKMQELVDDYNTFVNTLNKHIEEYETGVNESFDCFKNCMIKTIEDYIVTIDMKINLQDEKIQESIDYIKLNLKESITDVINEMKESGEIDESLLDAIENIGTRVANLESSLETNVNELSERINNLENAKPYLEYNEETKELTIFMDEKVGV